VGKIARITIEIEGQEMVFLNGGLAQQLNPAFSFFVRCLMRCLEAQTVITSFSLALNRSSMRLISASVNC
jgi:predicted 3-demethylubiquinone-9 3-methyltransferase (glyoxalase superfamily)